MCSLQNINLPKEKPSNLLLDTKETTTLLKISEGTLRNRAWSKKIPFVKVGRCVCFKKYAIEEFIEKNSFE